ncbi:MAG: primosomal protein N' [Oscillospiraceae bacterium]|nr:primosomal protein N' [Oscillospiraceae bacterium]
MDRFATLAVEVVGYEYDKPYEYLIPIDLIGAIKPGIRVVVPFGRGNRKTHAITLSVTPKPSSGEREYKPILTALDTEPVLAPALIKTALWMHKRVFCTVWQAVNAMLPSGLRFGAKGMVNPKTDYMVSLTLPAEVLRDTMQAVRSAPQKEVLEFLSDNGDASLSEIRYFTGAKTATVRELEKKNLVETSPFEVFRRPSIAEAQERAFVLTEEQKAVKETLCALIDQKKPACALLRGVTGSGKTNVYIELMRKVVSGGGQCIILAPEIALTPQLLGQITSVFGDRVALLHSGLSAGERLDEWRRAKSGLADVVVGTRSAVFAPLSNLRLIILDEEHEHTYKSDSAPRYHAREVAKYRSYLSDALVLLGSATPSMESMYAALSGVYTYVQLTKRYNEQPLPAVRLADLTNELRDGSANTIGRELHEEIRQNLLRNEQTILFLGRRGAAKHLLCKNCRNVPQCVRCSRAMAYHSVNRRLICHVCNHMERVTGDCEKCGGDLVSVGFGTQRAEEDIKQLFPNTAILRLDSDTTLRKGATKTILEEFAGQHVPILIGTQMVTKGLDFPGVTLVGVLNADASLYAPDFRAYERTYDVISQVVGRGGRGDTPGRALLQSYSGAHPVLIAAAKQDYPSFYEQEITLRRAQGLPPFSHLTRLCFFGASQDEVLHACMRVKNWINHWKKTKKSEIRLLGPAQAAILRQNLRYRYHITLLSDDRESLRDLCASVLTAFPKERKNKNVRLYADADALEE